MIFLKNPELKHAIKSFVIRLIIAIIFVSIARYATTNVILTNDIALGQLNGGNEAYIAWETYNKYRNIARYICYAIVFVMMFGPTKTLIGAIISKLKTLYYLTKKGEQQ